jgi:hypothetical protein
MLLWTRSDVWTQVHAGVVVVCSDQPVYERCVVFGFVAWWKEGFVSMLNRNFARHLMMGVFSRVCSGPDVLGNEGVYSVGFW